MLIDFETFRSLLKRTGIPVYRNKAVNNENYPFIIYTHAFEKDKRASNKLVRNIKTFQVSLFTTGTEEDINVLTNIFNDYPIGYAPFRSISGDENDDTVTNFFTYVEVIY